MLRLVHTLCMLPSLCELVCALVLLCEATRWHERKSCENADWEKPWNWYFLSTSSFILQYIFTLQISGQYSLSFKRNCQHHYPEIQCISMFSINILRYSIISPLMYFNSSTTLILMAVWSWFLLPQTYFYVNSD